MAKFTSLLTVFISLNSFSQNLLLNNLNISNQDFSRTQNEQIFASNAMLNNNAKVNQPAVVRPGSQSIRRVRNTNTIQRRQVRRITSTNNNIVQNPVQINQAQINPSAAPENNNDFQIRGNLRQTENNTGNSFGNEMNPALQMLFPELPGIPVVQLKNVSADLNINLPKMNIKPLKFSGRGSSASKGNHHKLLLLKNRFTKFNRRISGKLSFKKRLKIKVDNCFKW